MKTAKSPTLRLFAALMMFMVYLTCLSMKQSTTVMVKFDQNITQHSLDLPQNDEERYLIYDGFAGSPASTLVHLKGGCDCELLSIDCLDTIQCLPDDPLERIHAGVVSRHVLKKRASFWTSSLVTLNRGSTIGHASHEVTVLSWKQWLAHNELPKGILNEVTPYVNGTLYPYCQGNNLEGRACFINAFAANEEFGDLEKDAINQHQSSIRQEEQKATRLLESLQRNPYNATTLDFVLSFAQVSRVTFNVRSHLIDLYNQRVVTVDHQNTKNAHAADDDDKPILRLALHVRRRDACDFETSGYATEVSPLDSPAQASIARLCYDTKVYMDAILRIVDMVPDKHVVVYLATDHTKSLIDEIRASHSDAFQAVSWKYLDHGRNIYSEAAQEKDAAALLGEATVMELWHLSHGQVFVGHLGSRFGKMAYLQATARHYTFVPFYTVDGHAMCCDVDEACGAMAPHIVSMENCMGMFWSETKYYDKVNGDEYWKKGVTIRRHAAADERTFRREHAAKEYQLEEAATSNSEVKEVPDMIMRAEVVEEVKDSAQAKDKEPAESRQNDDDDSVQKQTKQTEDGKETDKVPEAQDDRNEPVESPQDDDNSVEKQTKQSEDGNEADKVPEAQDDRNERVESPQKDDNLDEKQSEDGNEADNSPNEGDDSDKEEDVQFKFDYIGSPAYTLLYVPDPEELEDCDPDFMGVDTLGAMRCLPSKPHEQMHKGIVMREMMKQVATFADGPLEDPHPDSTIGLTGQYATISVWRDWLSKKEIKSGFTGEQVAFANETRYTECVEQGLLGKTCFFHEFKEKEGYGALEKEAIEKFQGNRADLEESTKNKLEEIRSNPFAATTLDYLVAFSQMSHVTFNLRPHMHTVYEEHLKTIDHSNGKNTDDALRVALHIRRGDACRDDNKLEDVHSELHSAAQRPTTRLCYDFGVYADSIMRVSSTFPDRHTVVYLATDSPTSLVEVLKTEYADCFEAVSWKYLDYPREVFNYFGDKKKKDVFIDSPTNANKAILGETAVADIWHLSHGQVYVGHLGSRFGKMAYWQATARNNAFVPYFTVDGHTICCELDEPCGVIQGSVVSMENCLAVFWPDTLYKQQENQEEYLEQGSLIRMDAAGEEREYRARRAPDYTLESLKKEEEPQPPHEFAGSPAETLITNGDCTCELMSIDCLDAVRCLPASPRKTMHAGIVTRSLMKNTSNILEQYMEDIRTGSPIGMGSQAVTTNVWKGWLLTNDLPAGLIGESDSFINETRYEYCTENGLIGRRCFMHDFASEEEYGDLEKAALKKYSHRRELVEKAETPKLEALRSNPLNATSLDYLITFAHMSRITLNLRAHVLSIYNEHLKSIDNDKGTQTGSVLRVAMHFRRGDACRHETTGYEKEASLLDSPAQFSQERLCYDTKVYMDALRRVMASVPDRHIIVYVATDHSGSLVEEIKKDFPDLYGSLSWRYLEYSRDIFNYFGGRSDDSTYIESPRNKMRPILGETAIADIWHLSHGQVFIGHLGSRFGKLGWWQAIARYNSFVPYYTVDGHSVCCDIDEACGRMAKFVVSMENCLATFWPATRYTYNLNASIYFTEGAYFREEAAADEMKFRELGRNPQDGSADGASEDPEKEAEGATEASGDHENEDENRAQATENDEEQKKQEFIGSPASTNIEFGDCQCQLVSIDCLDSIRCLEDDPSHDVYAGVVARSVAKQLTTFRKESMYDIMPDAPVGKASQFVSINAWREWLAKKEMPKGLNNALDSFLDEKTYPECKEKELLGRRCFIDDFDADEEFGDLEKDALEQHQAKATHEERDAKTKLQSLRENPFKVSPLDYLLALAHISKITLNLRSHVHKVYEQHVKTVGGTNTASDGNGEFRVSMHFRRGDSCGHATSGYEKAAAPLDSPAQMGGDRWCYETAIYMKALERVVAMVPKKQVVVYLATDHSQSLIDEIKSDFSSLYEKVSWKFLDYSRDIFNYMKDKDDPGAFIEGPENGNKAQLGETALADIWHLSHGRVFIGHLGSRFGKLGWFQATARYNSFIPFYTVDGHSVCCDIDEPCGANAANIVSMENCMGVYWAESVYADKTTPEVYFKTGAEFRRYGAADELQFRKDNEKAVLAAEAQ